jgi:uncharacterized protein YdaU (DUF1376 family)
MNYYQFHIGDYASHTRHLTLEEDACYRRLLDLCYQSESPLPKDTSRISKLVLCPHEMVEYVLSEFFECKDDSGWINKRAFEEIEKYHAKKDSSSRGGKASAKKRAHINDDEF